MKKMLNQDSITVGIIATLVSELLCALLIWLLLLVIGLPVAEHARWFAPALVPPALLLRYYAHQKDYPLTLRAVITTFFVTVVLFMWFLLKYKHITF